MGDLEQFSIDLRETAKSLRAAGDADLARQLSKAVKDATKPILLEIRAELPVFMPTRYAATLAEDLSLSSSVRLTGRAGATATLRAGSRAGKKRKLKRLDQQGRLSHPFFGDRKRWFDQTARVTAGFFSRPATDAKEEIRGEIKSAMDKVADDAAARKVTP